MARAKVNLNFGEIGRILREDMREPNRQTSRLRSLPRFDVGSVT